MTDDLEKQGHSEEGLDLLRPFIVRVCGVSLFFRSRIVQQVSGKKIQQRQHKSQSEDPLPTPRVGRTFLF